MKVEEPVMLTATQVAERYGITSGNLRQMRFRHEGPPFYKPTERVVLYRIDELEEWLNTTRTDPSTEKERSRLTPTPKTNERDSNDHHQ